MPQVTGVEITARPGTLLEPLPEGGRYPGFVFAEGAQPDDVIATLRGGVAPTAPGDGPRGAYFAGVGV